MNKLILKGLFMTVIVFIASTITTTGMPADLLAWEILGITTAGTVIGYLAQSIVFPSTSILGSINLRDLLKGGFLSVSNLLGGVCRNSNYAYRN